MDGEAIPYRDFEAFVERQAGEGGAAMSSPVLSGLFDQFVERRLLGRWLRDRGVAHADTDPIAVLLEEVEVEPPTPEEIRTFYEASAESFERPLRVRLRQILVEDEETARRALEELEAGAELGRVAERLAVASEGAGGSLEGVVSRDDVPAAFESVIFSLEEGELSGVVAAEYGFHIFQVVERLPQRRLTLEEATPEIRRELDRRAVDRQLGALVERAVGRYNIEVHERNLPFLYRGRFARTPRATARP